MAFLPDCRRSRATLAIDSRRRRLVFRRAGGRCHLPPLQFVATVRTPSGRLLYRGPAVAGRRLAGANLAGDAVLSAPLLPGLLQCDVQGPVLVVVRGHGLAAAGAIHCRGSR
jgi:hypothetical protein